MKRLSWNIEGRQVPVIELDTAVVGSGCAGFNAADWLWSLGRRDIALLTEGVNMGTSRNTGSDKQTYYKLSLASDGEDSVASMAADLFAGEGVDGDTALAEAAGSVRSFIKLCNLGVPFPVNEYGEYVGYKTDHDPRQRATSAGPLTSRYMTEALERAVRDKGVPILDGMTAVRLLTREGEIEGLICLDAAALDGPAHGLTVVRARRVILATGGPAGCYARNVYPHSQTGMSGLALEAGAAGNNLDQWQYGLASLKFRWNVSGTYQQVLPRYISVDKAGVEREFLPGYFDSPAQALDRVFLKGYQWPFDTTKVEGSSLIDILVHHETVELGRRVYLDYRTDPAGLEQGFGGLSEEARRYLANSDALLPTPIARLEKMNPPAIELYRAHGIDLYTEPLEIGVCAQHHNGGLQVDAHWQTTIRGLYAAGEAAGTFGVHRPGGSALNSTQVGAQRAAEHIAAETVPEPASTPVFEALARAQAARLLARLDGVTARSGPGSTVQRDRRESGEAMSACAAHLRDPAGMAALAAHEEQALERFWDNAHIAGARELPGLLKNRDLLITRLAVLSAMQTAARTTGSRGSALVLSSDGEPVCPGLPGLRALPQRPLPDNLRLRTCRSGDGFVSEYVPVRPLPRPDGWFETVWEAFRQREARRRSHSISEEDGV